MRSFIAIEIPPDIKAALARLQTELRRAGADVSWVKPENIHLTLKFLGEVDEERIAEIEKLCSASRDQSGPFTLSLGGVGVFPNTKKPRTLWAGLAGEIGKAVGIQIWIEESLAELGFKREEKEWRPHLTIGRLKSNKNTRELLALASAYALPELSFMVKEIVLMKSELRPEGSRYTPIFKFPLI